MPRLRFAILGAGLLGAVLPIASQISAVLGDRIFSSRLASVYLWPSSIWLLATDGHEYEPGAYLVVVLAHWRTFFCMRCWRLLCGFLSDSFSVLQPIPPNQALQPTPSPAWFIPL